MKTVLISTKTFLDQLNCINNCKKTRFKIIVVVFSHSKLDQSTLKAFACYDSLLVDI